MNVLVHAPFKITGNLGMSALLMNDLKMHELRYRFYKHIGA